MLIVIKKIGVGSNVWKWRVSKGRGRAFEVLGYFDNNAEAETFVKGLYHV